MSQSMSEQQYEYDYLIVGSGFGGSVSALRLAEKGWKVAVLEQGRRIGQKEIQKAKKSPMSLLWLPALKAKGFLSYSIFRHLSVLKGVGVGGGSLVWAAVMIEPKPSFYEDEHLKKTGVNWKEELDQPFKTAKKMFGVQQNPKLTKMDGYLEETAKVMGVIDSFGAVPNAIYFGEKGVKHSDPYFSGNGPERTGCEFCSGCISGCPYGSKNSLDYNYLYFAEKKGVDIFSETTVKVISPIDEGGYQVTAFGQNGRKKIYRTKNLVLSAGVVGTLMLLFQNKVLYKTLPNLSDTLGACVRTNSESITAIIHGPEEDLSDGATISSDFYPDKNTHITQNRLDKANRPMRFMLGPFSNEHRPFLRFIKTILLFVVQSPRVATNYFGKNWEKRVTVLTVMQDLDSQLRIAYKRRWWWFFKYALVSNVIPDKTAPSYIKIANEATENMAKISGGKPLNNLLESLFGISVTAHILSGCPMGEGAEDSVLTVNHEVHNYPGLFVVDGASIPANIGVNPSLTISAMAERFAEKQPTKNSAEIA